MELKPGYKQTEVGVIPEEWEAPAGSRGPCQPNCLSSFSGGSQPPRSTEMSSSVKHVQRRTRGTPGYIRLHPRWGRNPTTHKSAQDEALLPTFPPEPLAARKQSGECTSEDIMICEDMVRLSSRFFAELRALTTSR